MTSPSVDPVVALARALAERYVVERELGRGGMAVVYRATDRRHGRPVAIKVLHPELATAVGAERFLQEIRTAAQLTHPHILAVFDSGEAEGLLYYVMPFMPGESLRDRLLREKQLGLDDALALTREVGDALAYAHDQGVVHRDIKPENILLSGAHAAVADFGIARALTGAGGARLTLTGMSLGTPAYMSPEQATAEREVDGRSDQYSLACMLYEMLAGEPPYTGPNAQAVIAKRLLQDAPSVRIVRPSVPAPVDAALQRALARAPADRFPTVRHFLTALSAPAEWNRGPAQRSPAVSGATSGSLSSWRLSALQPTARRWVVLVGILTLVLSAGVIWRGRSPPALDPRRVVVGLISNQTGDPALDYLGTMAADWITAGLQNTGIVNVVPPPVALSASRYVDSLTAREPSGRRRDPIALLARETGAGTVVTGSFYPKSDLIEFRVRAVDLVDGLELGDPDPVAGPRGSPMAAIETVRQRLMGALAASFDERLAAVNSSANRPPTFESYRAFQEGMELYIRNRFREAVPGFIHAFTLDSTFIIPLLYAAFSSSNLGDHATSDSLARIVAVRRDELSVVDQLWLQYLQAQLAGDRGAALRAIRGAARLSPGSKAAYNVAYVALQLNRPDEAITALQSLNPERGPMRGWLQYWTQLADALHRLERHEEELTAARRARSLFPYALEAVRLEADALAALGRAAAVDSLLAAAGMLPTGGTTVGEVMIIAGEELRAHGRLAEAASLFDRAVHWCEMRPPAEAATSGARSTCATALENAGRGADAERIVRSLADESPDNFRYRGWLGYLAAHRGDSAAARAALTDLQGVQGRYLLGAPQFAQARIAAVLGESERAVTLLRAAFGAGHPRLRHLDWNFRSLETYPSYQQLIRPEG